jgi:hypothetical protein
MNARSVATYPESLPPTGVSLPVGWTGLSRTQQRHIHEKLRLLGIATYREYLDSSYWQTVSERYRASDRWQHCAVCGQVPFQLHHRTYKHLGREPLSDLMPLCRSHHAELHARGLDIWGGHRQLWVGA